MPVTTASRSGASQPCPAAAGPPRAFLDLGAVLTAPGCARAWTRKILWEWGVAELAESAELIASELVTNSVNAGGGGIRLVLTLDRGELAVLVRDGHPAAPLAGQPGADDESGRGLLIVEALSDRCGWYPLQSPQHAKVTWAVISASASGGEPPAGARAGGPATAADTRARPGAPGEAPPAVPGRRNAGAETGRPGDPGPGQGCP